MADESNSDDNSLDLLHPEMLSLSNLQRLLKKRCIPVECLHGLDKVKLVELYYKTVMPLPQRYYKQNRRGQLLTRKRDNILKRKAEAEIVSPVTCRHSAEPLQKLSKIVNVLPVSVSAESSRLKPPPSPVNFDKKTIKLNIRPSNGADTLSVKSTTSPVHDSGRKIIRLINDTLQSSIKSETTPKPGTKVPNCKKAESKVVSILTTRDTDNSTEDVSPKKKHKPITWP